METSSKTPLIVVVEDEEHLAQGLLFNLQAEGYRVHHESDGDSASNRAMLQIRTEAISRKHWETVRDVERRLALQAR